MKIIFVLDDQSVIVTTPEELELRQIQEGLAALGTPAGTNEAGDPLFRPIITYPVKISIPKAKKTKKKIEG
jgi:hypothetical protein